ncbi:MAG: outer membrane lipoprotein carrier protein LolA [Thermodesulfobacteriota bacterium]
MLKRLSFFSVTALLLMAYGCAGPPPRRAAIGEMKRGVRPEAIRARATVTLEQRESLRGRAVIVAKRPGSFRIDVFGPFGQSLAVLASDGKTLVFFSKDGLRAFEPGGPEITANLSPARLVSILLGDRSHSPIEGDKSKRGREDRAERSAAEKDGRREPEINLSDFRDVDGAIIPHNISIAYGGKRIEIRYREIEIDPEIKAEVFNITGFH